MAMEKRHIALICVLAVLVISPLVLLSTWFLRKVENHAISHLESPSSPERLMKVAWVYRSTFRPEHAKRAYRTFTQVFPQHPDAIEAHWQYVLLVVDTDIRQFSREALAEFVAKWRAHARYGEYEEEVRRVYLFAHNL